MATDKSLHQIKRRAYVTLFSHEDYLPGVLALQRSALQAGLRHPLLVMATPSVSSQAVKILREEGCEIRRVDSFHPESVDRSHYVRQLYAECWNKLQMWSWEDEFSRLVYLDADMVVLRNIDHLFDLPPAPLYAVGDCFGGRHDDWERNACCHFTPEQQPEYFNAGFYVMEPKRSELEAMKMTLQGEETAAAGWRFAEQDFLNLYFAERWRHMPFIYNAQKRIKTHHPELWDLNEIAVVHYVDEKPWSHRYSLENSSYREEVERWWAIFENGEKKKERKDETRKEPHQMGPADHLLTIPRMQIAAAAAAAAAREA